MKPTESVHYSSQTESNSHLTLLATNTQTTQTSFDENNRLIATNNTTTDHTTLSNYDTSSTTTGILTSEKSPISNEQTLYPPLRVRLQKVNEKSVALKWDHNQLNVNNKIDGYRIYINSILRGTVKPTDIKALINGIQEEGEYKLVFYFEFFIKSLKFLIFLELL
jgi:hypothetical protein